MCTGVGRCQKSGWGMKRVRGGVGREVEGGEPWTPCVVAGGGVDGGVWVGEGVKKYESWFSYFLVNKRGDLGAWGTM